MYQRKLGGVMTIARGLNSLKKKLGSDIMPTIANLMLKNKPCKQVMTQLSVLSVCS